MQVASEEVIRLCRSCVGRDSMVDISVVLKKEVWEEELDGYTLDQPFTSDLRLAGFYSDVSSGTIPTIALSPASQMLVMLLKQLVSEKKARPDSVIVIEADPSEDDALVRNVYKSIGFEWRAPSIVEASSDLCGGGLMCATIGVICDTCASSGWLWVGDGGKV